MGHPPSLLPGFFGRHTHHRWLLHEVAKVPHKRDIGECNTVLLNNNTMCPMNVAKRMKLQRMQFSHPIEQLWVSHPLRVAGRKVENTERRSVCNKHMSVIRDLAPMAFPILG